MSHEFESGYFTKQEAWHGLGTVLAEAPKTDEEALKAAGLDWNVLRLPLSFQMGERTVTSPMFGLVRDSDERFLGRCKEHYHVVQNSEAMSWCQPLVDTGLWTYETGGSLREGVYCWALLKQEEREIVPNDVLSNYLFYMWNHSGSNANVVAPTSVRVVCSNTLQMALNVSADQGTQSRILHNRFLPQRMEEIREYHELLTAQFQNQADVFDSLLKAEWNENKTRTLVNDLFPVSEETMAGSELTIAKRNNEAVMAMAVGGEAAGAEIAGVNGTAYGALMAVSEFNEHYLSQGRVKDRGVNILLGKGAKGNREAFARISEMTNLS